MAASASLVRIERPEEGIVLVQLDDPADKNALSEPLIEQLLAGLAAVGSEPGDRVCILCGLPEIFCSGGHRDMLHGLARGEVAASDIMVPRAVIEVPLPTIAAMEGHAVGGGLALGLCCDLVLMARESRYGCSFMNLGFTPGMATTRLLALAVGEHLAAEMMYGGQYFRGTHFAERGVNYVLPRSQVLSRALALARRIADKPRHALELLKRELSLTRRLLFEQARTAETAMHQICFARPETARLIDENFLSGERD